MEFVNIPVSVAIQIDVGRDVQCHHERLLLGRKLPHGRGIRGRTGQGHLRGKVRLVAVKVVVAVNQDLRVERRNDPGEIVLGEICECQVLGPLEVDALEAKGRSGIQNEDARLLAHGEESVQVDESAGAVGLDFPDKLREVVKAYFRLGIFLLLCREDIAG